MSIHQGILSIEDIDFDALHTLIIISNPEYSNIELFNIKN